MRAPANADPDHPPGGNPANTVSRAIAAVLNAYLSADPEIAARLAAMAGRVLVFELTKPQIIVALQVQQDRLLPAPTVAAADVRLYGELSAFIKAATRDNGFHGLSMQGSIGTVQTFWAILQAVEIDWEAWLAVALGQPLGNEAAKQARRVAGWVRDVGEDLPRDVVEWLQEEARLLTPTGQLQAFAEDVSRTRDDVERLAVRVERLSRRLAPVSAASDP